MLCTSPRDLPSVGKLMESPKFSALSDLHGETLVKLALREVLDKARQQILTGCSIPMEGIECEVLEVLSPGQKAVLNLTGTVLHTNLGRAPLGAALQSVAERLQGYSVLEYDLKSGKRGRRGDSAERLVRWLTGAPAAVMVNNCAAAMILLLSTHAVGREVIVSRGELVEIGGSYRVPDILRMSGCKLVEVGATNRTRISDFEKAITEDTAMILSTHRSNFEIVGFTESPSPEQYQKLAAEHGILTAHDLGSGMLTRVVEDEPTVGESLGFDLTAFSGDKLLGGPQCGIIIGQPHLVEACRKHPLFRALRCDKLTLALMEETLRRHARGPRHVQSLQLLSTSLEELQARAESVLSEIKSILPETILPELSSTRSQVGGGTMPGGTLDSVAIRLSTQNDSGALQDSLRRAEIPIVSRIENEQVLLDFRALSPEEDSKLLESLRKIFT